MAALSVMAIRRLAKEKHKNTRTLHILALEPSVVLFYLLLIV